MAINLLPDIVFIIVVILRQFHCIIFSDELDLVASSTRPFQTTRDCDATPHSKSLNFTTKFCYKIFLSMVSQHRSSSSNLFCFDFDARRLIASFRFRFNKFVAFVFGLVETIKNLLRFSLIRLFVRSFVDLFVVVLVCWYFGGSKQWMKAKKIITKTLVMRTYLKRNKTFNSFNLTTHHKSYSHSDFVLPFAYFSTSFLLPFTSLVACHKSQQFKA